MKRKTLWIYAASVLMLAQSCNNSNTASHDKEDVALSPNDSLFHVNQGGYDFDIILPKDLMIANTPEIKMNGATGELHILLGSQFWIVASLEKTSMNVIKSAINEDMLFSTRVVEENSNSILYQRILPDGTEYDFNFRSFSEIGGKPYYFKTCDEGEFSIDNVTRMKEAISSVRSAV